MFFIQGNFKSVNYFSAIDLGSPCKPAYNNNNVLILTPSSELANDLNIFYNCFNIQHCDKELSTYKNAPQQHVGINIDTEHVLKPFRGVKERKGPGPDKVSGQLLKNSAEPLAEIFTIFTISLRLHSVPRIWKDSEVVPAPKVTAPKSLNDFGPVAKNCQK